MREVFEGILIASVVMLAMGAFGALWVRHRIRRELRIAPSVRSAAPTVWLVSPTSAARLHHRLRRVGASARAAGIRIWGVPFWFPIFAIGYARSSPFR